MSNYKKVYFRINTPSYYKATYGVGFKDQQATELFNKTVANIFLNDGWEIKKERYFSSGSCTTVIKDKQELYLHPQNFSGVVKEDNILYIENLLSNCNMFSFEKTDIYEDIFDISDEEYINILKSKQQYIENDILDIFKTKRRNLYITSLWTPLNNVLNKYRIKRLSHYIGVFSSDDIDIKWINEIFETLVEENKIITAETKNGTGYRTATKKDIAA